MRAGIFADRRRRIALFLGITMVWAPRAPAQRESFDTAPQGELTRWESGLGVFSAAPGHAEVHRPRHRSAPQSLRLLGGGERALVLDLAQPSVADTQLAFHAERWTGQEPFRFRVEADTGAGFQEIVDADRTIQVGGFKAEVIAPLPEGTKRVRFISETPANSGVLMDDLWLDRPGPMQLFAARCAQSVTPVLIRRGINPVLGLEIETEGRQPPARLTRVEIDLKGTTRLEDVASVALVAGGPDPEGPFGEEFDRGRPSRDGRVTLRGSQALAASTQWFWVSVRMKDRASLDGRVDARISAIQAGDRRMTPSAPPAAAPQRVGVALRQAGDDGSKAYRIPGIVESKEGTLLAVYDIRRRHNGDLPADIDVGLSRSTDRGQTWEPMRVVLDMGKDPKFGHDGVGDPAILVDEVTGRVWIAALWSHGNRGWNGSGPGITPDETGQFVLVYSDDDGRTWSGPINITPQVKKPEWRLMFNGPGAGITMRDGTLVFAAQFREADGPPHHGKPFSTIIWSRDSGSAWTAGAGIKIDTTEAQVVELGDGSLMLNCRDNRGGSRTVGVTRDLGRTWEPHPTDRAGLPDPVCMASLLSIEHPALGPLLLFSNPATTRGRRHMTVKVSRDEGQTWPETMHTLYDARSCSGYSCLAPAGPDHVAVLYEGSSEIFFLRLPLEELVR
ncbi:MAG: exo-alpha-sialidase [Kiritimatiellae bacterium]|nr:exo-alpha-sialidase [Kiritimatiellia bacterium]